jgi:hypothetical protein
VVDIEAHHLGGAARGAARLDGAGGAVADLQERHQPGGLATTRKRLALAAQVGEVRAGPGAVLEQPCLAGPQVHDAAIVDEIVGDGLDEAGVRLGVFVGVFRVLQATGGRVGVPVALGRSRDVVPPVQAGVEPLRRVGRGHLRCEHVAELVVERVGVLVGVEVAVRPPPVGPTPREPVEHLAGVGFGTRVGPSRVVEDLVAVFIDERHAGLAEVLLYQHVDGDLRPPLGDRDAFHREHESAVRVADFARALDELDVLIRVLFGTSEPTADLHS